MQAIVIVALCKLRREKELRPVVLVAHSEGEGFTELFCKQNQEEWAGGSMQDGEGWPGGRSQEGNFCSGGRTQAEAEAWLREEEQVRSAEYASRLDEARRRVEEEMIRQAEEASREEEELRAAAAASLAEEEQRRAAEVEQRRREEVALRRAMAASREEAGRRISKRGREVTRILGARDHWEVLGLTGRASKEEVRTAHRRLVLLVHPDKCTEPGAGEACARLQQVTT